MKNAARRFDEDCTKMYIIGRIAFSRALKTRRDKKRDTQTLEGPCPGVIRPLEEGPCPGVIGPLGEGPCPGVIGPLVEGPCSGGTAVGVLLPSLPVSVAALPAGLTLARRSGPLGHWVQWFGLRQRSSQI